MESSEYILYTQASTHTLTPTHTHIHTHIHRETQIYTLGCVSDAIKFNQSPQQSGNLRQYAKNILRLQTTQIERSQRVEYDC